MGQPKITFGDKLFIYGHYIELLDDYESQDYNAVMGYMTVGGFLTRPQETDVESASIPGFLVDFPVDEQFTVSMPFTEMEMIDVAGKLALDQPLPTGTRIWMPVPSYDLLPA